FHPSDPRTVFQKEFYEILQTIQRQRAAGNVWVATMGDLASYCEARECVRLQSKTEKDKRTLQIRSSLNSEKYGIPDITMVVPSKAMPKSIQRQTDGALVNISPDAVCAQRNGTLILNLPAVTQTVTLSF